MPRDNQLHWLPGRQSWRDGFDSMYFFHRSSYIYVMRTDGGSAGQITCKLPDTSGVLAVQGTSGRNYKDDIKPADPQEALDRGDGSGFG